MKVYVADKLVILFRTDATVCGRRPGIGLTHLGISFAVQALSKRAMSRSSRCRNSLIGISNVLPHSLLRVTDIVGLDCEAELSRNV